MIQCDETLKNLFHVNSFLMSELPEHLQKHLSPPPPLEFSFTVAAGSDNGYLPDASQTPEVITRDITVELPDGRVKSFTGISAPALKELQFLENKVSRTFYFLKVLYFSL